MPTPNHGQVAGKRRTPFCHHGCCDYSEHTADSGGRVGGPKCSKTWVPIFGYHATGRRYKCEDLQQLSTMSGKWRRGRDFPPISTRTPVFRAF